MFVKTVGYAPPVKRSVLIAGHPTSVSLEPLFWQLLEQAASARAMPLSALIAEVDAARLGWRPTPNLTSALRQWLLRQALGSESN